MRGALLLLPVLLTACGDAAVPLDAAGTSVTVEVRADEAAPVRSWTLTCDPPGGDHPDPAGGCAGLDALAPVPADAVCTEIYGGPELARVYGTVRGAEVDQALSRVNGCEIAAWDAVGALLPTP